MTEPTINQALAAVMADIDYVGKGDRNDFHKFMFRGIDRVINKVGPAFRKHGVLCLPSLQSLESRDVQTEKGKTSREVTVTVAYTFHGPAGDTLTTVVPGEAQDTGDKAVSKAMSVAYRTALIQAFTIPTEQTDPDAQTYERRVEEAIKNKVWAEAQKRGWDVDELAANYYEWSTGEDIREADDTALTEFLRHLNPPKKAQRKPLSSVPEPPAVPEPTATPNAAPALPEPPLEAV